MSQRDSNLRWLKDVIEHLGMCQEQLEWAEDAAAVRVLTQTMLRDLECCRRLCESLHGQANLQAAA